MSVCQYDNPSTMRRELWQSGKKIAHLSVNVLDMKPKFRGDRNMHFGFDLSEWETGKVRGDVEAIEEGEKP